MSQVFRSDVQLPKGWISGDGEGFMSMTVQELQHEFDEAGIKYQVADQDPYRRIILGASTEKYQESEKRLAEIKKGEIV